MLAIKRLQFTTIRHNPETILADTLVLGVYEGRHLTEPAQRVDRLVQRKLSAFLADRAFEGRMGQMMSFMGFPGLKAQEILIIGLGVRDKWNRAQFRKAQSTAMEYSARTGSRTIINTLTAITEGDIPAAWRIRHAVEATYQAIYRFTECLGKNSKKSHAPRLERVHFVLTDIKISDADARSAIASGSAIAQGVFLCRNLANLPPNIATPRFLAAEARKLVQSDPRFKLKVLTERELKRGGLNALMAVSQGSHEPP
ncbi:Leucyl aminopeptidase, partial [mine drainage metagenome]